MITANTTKFVARFETTTSMGWAVFETENEMYATLEFDRITEDNPSVRGINYYEVAEEEDGSGGIVRSWDFGKPWESDWWKKN